MGSLALPEVIKLADRDAYAKGLYRATPNPSLVPDSGMVQLQRYWSAQSFREAQDQGDSACMVGLMTDSKKSEVTDGDSDFSDLLEESMELLRKIDEADDLEFRNSRMASITEEDKDLIMPIEEEPEVLSLPEPAFIQTDEMRAKFATLTSAMTRIDRLLREVADEHDGLLIQTDETLRLSAVTSPLLGLRDAFESAFHTYRGDGYYAALRMADRLQSTLRGVHADDQELLALLNDDALPLAGPDGPQGQFALFAAYANRVEQHLTRTWIQLSESGWLMHSAGGRVERENLHEDLLWTRSVVTAFSMMKDDLDSREFELRLRGLITVVSTDASDRIVLEERQLN